MPNSSSNAMGMACHIKSISAEISPTYRFWRQFVLIYTELLDDDLPPEPLGQHTTRTAMCNMIIIIILLSKIAIYV